MPGHFVDIAVLIYSEFDVHIYTTTWPAFEPNFGPNGTQKLPILMILHLCWAQLYTVLHRYLFCHVFLSKVDRKSG